MLSYFKLVKLKIMNVNKNQVTFIQVPLAQEQENYFTNLKIAQRRIRAKF